MESLIAQAQYELFQLFWEECNKQGKFVTEFSYPKNNVATMWLTPNWLFFKWGTGMKMWVGSSTVISPVEWILFSKDFQ